MNENTGKLSSADIRHFSKWLEFKQDYSKLFWAFTCFSRQDYADEVEIPYLDEVCYGLWHKNGGCVCEMMMVWERIGGGAFPVIQSFSDSFAFLSSPTQKKVFEKLMKMRKECFTPEEFSYVLLSCGFRDMSDKKIKQERIAVYANRSRKEEKNEEKVAIEIEKTDGNRRNDPDGERRYSSPKTGIWVCGVYLPPWDIS